MLLVLVGGVMSANATPKRIYIEVQNTYWQTPAQSVLKAFFKSGGSDLNTWPGDVCTRIEDTNWYYIDYDNDVTSATCIITTTESGNTWQTNEVSINLSKRNIIYLYDDGGGKLSIQNYDKFVIADANRSELLELSQNDYIFTGTLDLTNASGNTYFAVFPKRGTEVGDWNYCFRPNSENDYEFSSFQNYEWSFTSSNNGKTWLDKLKMKYDVEFNLVTGKFKFSPYFTRTLPAAAEGYGTFSSQYDVTVPEGLTAKYATDVTAGKITWVEFENGIKAGQGALLEGTAGEEYKFTPAASAVAPSNNLMKAIDATTAASALGQSTADGTTNFIFTKVGDKVGFFKVNGNGSWVNAGTAYLQVSNDQIPAQAPDYISIDGETTGVANVNAAAVVKNQYYTLDGRHVTQPTKGLYIVNGKKVIVK